MRGLSKDPRQRYPDSVAFAAELTGRAQTGERQPGLTRIALARQIDLSPLSRTQAVGTA